MFWCFTFVVCLKNLFSSLDFRYFVFVITLENFVLVVVGFERSEWQSSSSPYWESHQQHITNSNITVSKTQMKFWSEMNGSQLISSIIKLLFDLFRCLLSMNSVKITPYSLPDIGWIMRAHFAHTVIVSSRIDIFCLPNFKKSVVLYLIDFENLCWS